MMVLSDSDVSLIQHIEELAANAWPSAIVQIVDGWRLRFNWGVTSRANSVWPNATAGRLTLAEKMASADDFYARWGIPARYQICPAALPANLDDVLSTNGFEILSPTCVQTALLSDVHAHSAKVIATQPATVGVTITEHFDDIWFATYCQAENVNKSLAEARQAILQHIGPRTGYVLARHKETGEPVALALGVLEQGWMGIFNVATRPEYRRQGAATAVLHALTNWGQGYGAARVYLQVQENNSNARSLYQRLGFQTLYHYHYRERRRG